MSPTATTLWLLNASLDAGGQIAFKIASRRAGDAGWGRLVRQPALWLGLACYGGELLAWTAFLSLVPLSLGVLLGSINIIVLMIAGRMLFGERLTPLRIAGAALVCAGVALVGAAG